MGRVLGTHKDLKGPTTRTRQIQVRVWADPLGLLVDHIRIKHGIDLSEIQTWDIYLYMYSYSINLDQQYNLNHLKVEIARASLAETVSLERIGKTQTINLGLQ
jgi:hypothetical protein